jgi:hypothetical protein
VRTMSAPILLPEPLDVLIVQLEFAAQYRPIFHEAAIDFATRFSPGARKVAIASFVRRIGEGVPDAGTRSAVEACAITEFAKMEN